MILSQLSAYVAERRRVPLSDLAAHFELDPDAVRGMLRTLIRKGRVRAVEFQSCSSCCGCAAAPPEIYEWVTGKADLPAAADGERRAAFASGCC